MRQETSGLTFCAVLLLACGNALTASGQCQRQAKAASSLADSQSAASKSTGVAPCRSTLPIERDPVFGVILVDILVNGKPAVVILDTGSNTTMLSPEAASLDPASLRRAFPPKLGTGFAGQRSWGLATLAVGARTWKDHRVLVADLKSISDTMHRKIDGILGEDILGKSKYIEIDLEHNRLILVSD